MSASHIVETRGLTFRYGERVVLHGVDLSVPSATLVAVLGPNGSGKSTLFRLLSTLVPLQSGDAVVCGYNLRTEYAAARTRMGVVFQSPALDRKLTVHENLRFQAALVGLPHGEFAARESALLQRFALADRRHDLVETLSGGMRRRVELAKGLLNRPQVLLLDEPSTGLDPNVRRDLGTYLQQLRDEEGVTILLTTHLLDEAERANVVVILHEGKIIATGTPTALQEEVGECTVEIETDHPADVAQQIQQRWSIPARIVDGSVRLDMASGVSHVATLMAELGNQIRAIRISRPSLEDVFVAKTGHHLDAAQSKVTEGKRHR